MTIVVKEIHDGRAGNEDVTSGQEYARIYRVTTDSHYTEAATILADSQLPQLGDQYPFNTSAWCQRRNADNQDYSKRFWIVTCWYSTKSQTSSGGSQQRLDPLQEPAKVSCVSEPYEMPAKFDASTGEAIVNTAGDPFMPPPHVEYYRRVWTVKRNISHPDYAGWAALGSLNLSAVTFEAGQGSIAALGGLIKSIGVSDWQERNQIIYYTATIVISGVRYHNDPNQAASHKLETLNVGMNCWRTMRNSDGTETTAEYLQPCLDSTGDPVRSPALLDDDGHQSNPRYERPIWLYWNVHPPVAWSGTVPGIL